MPSLTICSLPTMMLGRPDVCVRSCRIVAARQAGGRSVRYPDTGAARSSRPSSISCMAATPTKALVMELIVKVVREVTGTESWTLAKP